MTAPPCENETTTMEIAARFAGPPGIGHGGYVAGLFFAGERDGLQVTLRRPAPLDRPLRIVRTGDRAELLDDEDLIADAVPAALDLVVPVGPTLAAARAAMTGSPSHYNGRGVHPTCFGCGLQRNDDEGLGIAAGPVEVDGVPQVAAVWTPTEGHGDGSGHVRAPVVAAALDCPGAFAFIANGDRAGLLGRITIAQQHPVPVGAEHIVIGWRVGVDGRKLFAGTALLDGDGRLLAAARAIWFPVSR